ncbi:MAG TPA: RNA polymerase sigma-54 factor, partial [Firmicutes bacterium]|nr:RNA polymerase sigma-54 factor [Bacillota bacterium]
RINQRGVTMELKITQSPVQQQKLVLTPEMQQSLKILQMPLFELQQDIARELDENPLLEVSPEEENEEGQEISGEKEDLLPERLIHDIVNQNEPAEFEDSRERMDPLDFVSAKATLKDYLMEQLLSLHEPQSILSICRYMIENIDEKGYLGCPVEELAMELKMPLDRINYALTLVQDFEPVGVAARDLKECLKIQLRKRLALDETMDRIVDECLELVAGNKVREIARRLNVEVEKAGQYCQMIKTLEPKPARGFYTGGSENYIIPEAYIVRNNDQLFILMNESMLPQLTVNRNYVDILRKQEDPEAFHYIKTKLNSALYFMKGIEHRKKTIFGILEKIIELQSEYFRKGESYLRPMTIADIAASLHLHESTISRAIRDKYICTPFKTIQLKDLFTGGISQAQTEGNISSNLVKLEIGKIITHEDKTRPLSDQDICEVLKNMKFEISRRTVAKYREEMEIGSSGRRKIFL